MDLMYIKKKTSRKQYRILLLMLIFSLLHDQSVGTNAIFHLMEESTWLEAQENCIHDGGHLASHEDISKSDVQQITSCLTSEQIWLDKVKVVTPYISHKGSLSELQPENNDENGSITECFLRCHAKKGFMYLDGLCECKRNDVSNVSTGKLFNVEEKSKVYSYMNETVGMFVCLGTKNTDPIETFVSNAALRSKNLKTVCRLPLDDTVILLNSTHGSWKEADIACANEGGYLPVSFVKKDCEELNISLFKTVYLWSGTRSYFSEILFKEFISTETLNYTKHIRQYRKYVDCAHVKSLDKITDSDKCISIDTQLKYICITETDVDRHDICCNKILKNAHMHTVMIILSVCVSLAILAAVCIMYKRRNKEGVFRKMCRSKTKYTISRHSTNQSVETTLNIQREHSEDSESIEPLCNNIEIRNGACNTDSKFHKSDCVVLG